MISEGLKCNSTLTTLCLWSDEKEEKEIRRNNKGTKKREKEKEMCMWCEIVIMKMIIISIWHLVSQLETLECVVSVL